MRCALQLYSVRGAAERDLAAVVEHVGGLGLDGVEVAGLHGHEPRRVRAWLDDAGLAVAAAHVGLDELEADPLPVYRVVETLGADLAVVGWLPPSLSSAVTRGYVERLDRASRAARAAGLRLGFHTHDAELRPADDGSVLLDLLLAGASLLELELDLGWAWIAGRDPAEVLERLGERCRVVHVKDFADRTDPSSFTSVGEGAVPFLEVLRRAQALDWLVAEQDDGFRPDELAAAARSAAAVVRLRGLLEPEPTPA
ncbi:MAG TPA: sugar phosphate isomerase/epimerase [Gaiellaceae bacterium]|nr:sugar phosphate isomerase/epimerase [Gaiellaceae bacterium]